MAPAGSSLVVDTNLSNDYYIGTIGNPTSHFDCNLISRNQIRMSGENKESRKRSTYILVALIGLLYIILLGIFTWLFNFSS